MFTWKHSEKQLVFFSRKAQRHYIKVNNKKRRERKKKNFDKAISPLQCLRFILISLYDTFSKLYNIFMKQYSILSEKRYQYVLTLIFSSTTQMQIFHLGNRSLLLKAQRHAIVLFDGVRCLFPCLGDCFQKDLLRNNNEGRTVCSFC